MLSSRQLNDNCRNPQIEGYKGALYVGDAEAVHFEKIDPNGIFSNSTKHGILYDIYPSTIPGHIVLAYGNNYTLDTVTISSAALGGIGRFQTSHCPIDKYSPFLAGIARTGKSIYTPVGNAVEDFLEQGFRYMPSAAQIWGYDAKFTIWARKDKWKRFLKLANPDRLWAAAFLSQYPTTKAQKTLLELVKETGASAGIVQRMENGKSQLVDHLLVSIIKMQVPFAKATKDKTIGLADSRNPDLIRKAAIRSLKSRLGVNAAPHFLALINSDSELPEEIEKNIHQTLYDLAPGKWSLQNVVVSGFMPPKDFHSTKSGPYLTTKKNPARIVRAAYISLFNKFTGEFKFTLPYPLKGKYILHYGKDDSKSISFYLNKAKINLGNLK